MVLNAAAHLVIGAGNYEHIAPVLRNLHHWLPVCQWIHYKVAVGAFNCVRGTGPAYFQQVCLPVADVTGQSHLHSAERHDMLVPRIRIQFGRPSFHAAALVICNSVQARLRSAPLVVDNQRWA